MFLGKLAAKFCLLVFMHMGHYYTGCPPPPPKKKKKKKKMNGGFSVPGSLKMLHVSISLSSKKE